MGVRVELRRQPASRWYVRLGLAAAVLALAGALASPLPATARSPLRVSLVISASSTARADFVSAAIGTLPGSTCELVVGAGRWKREVRGLRARRSGHAASFLRAPAPAGQPVWRFLARCTRGPDRAWSSWVGELGFARRQGALAAGVAAGPGVTCDAQAVCFARDPFERGQCTWYAAGRRPDLVGVVRGNAGEWLDAARGHLPEGTVPRVGAIAVWRDGVGFADRLGHVAYVAAVASGRILLDDSNWLPTPTSAPLQVHEHWEPSSSASGYIYGGPAAHGA